MEPAQGFPVTETFTYLVETYPVVRDKLFHPYFRRGDKPIGLILPAFAPPGGKVGGFKNFKTSLGDKVRSQEGGIHLKIAPLIKKSPDLTKNPGPVPK
jgi:hypothetical protein